MNLPFFLLASCFFLLNCIGLFLIYESSQAFNLLLQERKQVQIPGSFRRDMSVCLSKCFSSDSEHVRVEHSN